MPEAVSRSKSVRRASVGEVREAESSGEAPGVGRGDLDVEEPFQRLGQRPALGLCLVKDLRESVGGVGQPEVGEVLSQLLIDGRRGWGGGCRVHARVFLFFAAFSYAARSMTVVDGAAEVPRNLSAAWRASTPGGMRSLRRCGRPGGADIIAFCSSAVT